MVYKEQVKAPRCLLKDTCQNWCSNFFFCRRIELTWQKVNPVKASLYQAICLTPDRIAALQSSVRQEKQIFCLFLQQGINLWNKIKHRKKFMEKKTSFRSFAFIFYNKKNPLLSYQKKKSLKPQQRVEVMVVHAHWRSGMHQSTLTEGTSCGTTSQSNTM